MNETEIPEKAIQQYCSGRLKIRLSIGIMDGRSQGIYLFDEQGRLKPNQCYQYQKQE